MSINLKAGSHTVETIYGIKNGLHSYIDVPYKPDVEMTLNSFYNVHPGLLPTKSPKIKYFGIGIKGCYNTDDENGVSAYPPKNRNANLYSPIPFRLVPVEEDLSSDERKLYRMRVREQYFGIDYYAYYLKTIELMDSSIKVTITNQDPNDHTEIPYIMDPANLTPTPVKPDTSGNVSGLLSEVNVSIKALLPSTGKEVCEVINILFKGNMNYARISEYGLYTGEDRTVQGTSYDNQTFDYTEAIFAQLAVHHTNIGTDMSHPESFENKYLAIGSGSLLVL